MLFRQLFDKATSTYTYLLASDYGQEALLIDPVLEQISLYERLLSEYELTLVASLDTHIHADHITASGPLRQQYQSEIVMGQPCAAQGPTRWVSDGEVLSLAGIDMTCLYTPGHTDDSYSYLIDGKVFTGDILLIRATGRTDFQNGDPVQAYHSLFNKLLKLPGDTLVYPAHDYKGETVSTIAEERRFNPRLQVRNAEEYVEVMSHVCLDLPQQMEVAIPANLRCGLPPEATSYN